MYREFIPFNARNKTETTFALDVDLSSSFNSSWRDIWNDLIKF